MKSIEGAYPKRVSWAWTVGLLAAAAAAGLALWQTHGGYEPPRPEVGLLALLAALGGVWLYRARAARRLFAALDVYAERELARAEPRPPKPSVTGTRSRVKQRLPAVTGPTGAGEGKSFNQVRRVAL
jgi:hypothetical protein